MATAALPFHSAYIPKQPFEEAGIAAARSLKVYAAAGGYLVPEGQSRDLIEFLRHITAVRQYARVLPIAGTMTIPTMTAGAAAQYLGELVDDLAQDLVFGQRRLVSHKFGR
jgi:HK97 family phage major capsid protein